MAVSRDQVLAIAVLARLRVTDEEATRYATQLSDILDHVEALADAEADSAGDDTIDTPARLRPDVPAADALKVHPSEFAPAWGAGFFTVPRLTVMDSDAEESPS